MTVLVDSDILIAVSRGKDRAIVSRWTELSTSDAFVLFSPVNVVELWAGARAKEHDVLNRLFASLTCVDADAEVGTLAGSYLRRYQKSHGLELGDALIAASAVLANTTLWTRNRKHYPMEEIRFLN